MTEHEDLIAEARRWLKLEGIVPRSVRPALKKLANALKKVTAERDVLSSLREQMSLRLRYVEGKREQAEAERDGLAAVVHYLRLLTDGSDWNGGQVDDILDAAPSVELDRVKAEAWDEGESAGAKNQLNWDGWSMTKPEIRNPYRKGESNDQ